MAVRSQLPLQSVLIDKNQRITAPWAFWLTAVTEQLPRPGLATVNDGTAFVTGPTTIFQNSIELIHNAPDKQDLYISLNTGGTYTVNSSSEWQLQTPEFTGDISVPAFSTTATLKTVNLSPGTFGSQTTTPIITVNSKGLVTSSVSTATRYPILTVASLNGLSGTVTGTLFDPILTLDTTPGVISTVTNYQMQNQPYAVLASAPGLTITLPKAATNLIGKIWSITLASTGTVTIVTSLGDSFPTPNNANETTAIMNTRGSTADFRCTSTTTYSFV